MAITRRQVLMVAGTGAVIVAAGAAGFALTRRPDAALKPWETAGEGYGDPRLNALSYAILAPNPHNMQPWLVTLEGEDAFTLTYAPERLLRETDPFDRQIVIGLGCFLEVMRMAAAESGYRAETVLFPDGAPEPVLDGRPIARVRLVRDESVAPDPLFAQVLARRSSKEAYDTSWPVEAEKAAALEAATGAGTRVRVITGDDAVAALRDLTWRGHVTETTTPRVFQESIDVMRIGKAEMEAQPWGLPLGGALVDGLHKLGLLTREDLEDPSSSAFRQGLEMFRPVMNSGMAYVTITTESNRREDQIRSGRDWVRLNLKATEQGLSLHPVSQALQEYPEVADLYAELHEMLGETDARIQMLGRLGYGPDVAPVMREPLEAHMLKA